MGIILLLIILISFKFFYIFFNIFKRLEPLPDIKKETFLELFNFTNKTKQVPFYKSLIVSLINNKYHTNSTIKYLR